jgi:hypothetical protein
VQYVIRFLFSVQVRTESQLLADPTVRAAAAKTDILFSVGVRQQEAVQVLRSGAAPDALQLAFDGDTTLEAANRLQVCRDLISDNRQECFAVLLLLSTAKARLCPGTSWSMRVHVADATMPLTSVWHAHLLLYSRHAPHQSARPWLC